MRIIIFSLLILSGIICFCGCSSEPERVHTKKYYFHSNQSQKQKNVSYNENNYIHDNYFGPDFRYGVLTSKSFRGYNYRQRRVSIDRNYWFDGTPMNSGPFDINNWDGDNK